MTVPRVPSCTLQYPECLRAPLPHPDLRRAAAHCGVAPPIRDGFGRTLTCNMRHATCNVSHATCNRHLADRRPTARPIAINGIRCCCSTEYCRCQAYEHAHAIAPQASSPFYGICRVKLDRCDWEGYNDRRALHSTAPHCAALHCAARHCTALHGTALHCTALQAAELEASRVGELLTPPSTADVRKSLGPSITTRFDVCIAKLLPKQSRT